MNRLNEDIGKVPAKSKDLHMKEMIMKYPATMTSDVDYFSGKHVKHASAVVPLSPPIAAAAVHRPGDWKLPKRFRKSKEVKATGAQKTGAVIPEEAVRKLASSPTPSTSKPPYSSPPKTPTGTEEVSVQISGILEAQEAYVRKEVSSCSLCCQLSLH